MNTAYIMTTIITLGILVSLIITIRNTTKGNKKNNKVNQKLIDKLKNEIIQEKLSELSERKKELIEKVGNEGKINNLHLIRTREFNFLQIDRLIDDEINHNLSSFDKKLNYLFNYRAEEYDMSLKECLFYQLFNR